MEDSTESFYSHAVIPESLRQSIRHVRCFGRDGQQICEVLGIDGLVSRSREVALNSLSRIPLIQSTADLGQKPNVTERFIQDALQRTYSSKHQCYCGERDWIEPRLLHHTVVGCLAEPDLSADLERNRVMVSPDEIFGVVVILVHGRIAFRICYNYE